MLNITGYSDQISVAPGDAIKFMVNCEHRAYQADIVRIVSGDLNPEGPGIIEEAITTPVNGRYKGRKQKIYAGSYAIVPSSAPLETLESFYSSSHGLAEHAAERCPGAGLQMVGQEKNAASP